MSAVQMMSSSVAFGGAQFNCHLSGTTNTPSQRCTETLRLGQIWCAIPVGALGNGVKRPLLLQHSIAGFGFASRPVSSTRWRAAQRRTPPYLVRASSKKPETPPEDEDYSLPPLDFDELTGGGAAKRRAAKEKQEKIDAQLLQSWDSSPLAKESTYDMLGANRGGREVREYQADWKSVDPAEFLAKIGLYDREGESSVAGFPAERSPIGWDEGTAEPVRRRQVAPGQRRGPKPGAKRRPPNGMDRKRPGERGLAGRVSDNRGPEGGVASVSGRENSMPRSQRRQEPTFSKGMRSGVNLQTPTRSGGARDTRAFDELTLDIEAPKQDGNMGGGAKPRPRVEVDQSKEVAEGPKEISFDQWDLGLPDYDLVKKFMGEAPATAPGNEGLSGRSGGDRGPRLEAEFRDLNQGEAEGGGFELGAEELQAKARAIEEALGRRPAGGEGTMRDSVSSSQRIPQGGGSLLGKDGGVGGGSVEAGILSGGVESHSKGGIEPGHVDVGLGGAGEAPPGDDDSLLARFDEMMASKEKWLPYDVDVQEEGARKPGGVKAGTALQRGAEEWALEEGGEEEEALRREGEALMGGLVPEARARLEAERKAELRGEDEEDDTDSDEEIDEQFIEDPDWQDGWGEDAYMDFEEEKRKLRAARAAKKAEKAKRDIIDLTRGNEPLAGKLNRDGTVSIEGRKAGQPVRGIENLARGSQVGERKRVDVEKERRESDEFIKALHEGLTQGGVTKKAFPDMGSMWETPEMLEERYKEMAENKVEEEIEEEEALLEKRNERVVREFSLIDRVVRGGDEEDGEEVEENLVSEEGFAEDELAEEGLSESRLVSGGSEDGLEGHVENGRAKERLAAEETLRTGGFWADLDDLDSDRKKPTNSSVREISSVAVSHNTQDNGDRTLKLETETNSEIDVKSRTNRGEPSGEVSDRGSGAQNDSEVTTERATSSGRFEGKQSLLEQMRPPRLRKREEPKEETVEAVMSNYPELEFVEEVDPETGVVHQVIRHVGTPPNEIAAEEKREAERLSQSLTSERDEASMLVDLVLNAGAQVEEMISQLGREKRLNTDVLRAIDRKMAVAKKSKDDKAYETLDILYRYIEAEMERQNASPALRLLDELLQMDDGTLDEATWLRMCRDRMRREFIPESSIDIFNPPGVPKPRPDGTWEIPEEEGILRIDFVREVDVLLEDLQEQQRQFSQTPGFTAEAIAARLVFEQKMRTAAQLRKLKRNAAMLDI